LFSNYILPRYELWLNSFLHHYIDLIRTQIEFIKRLVIKKFSTTISTNGLRIIPKRNCHLEIEGKL